MTIEEKICIERVEQALLTACFVTGAIVARYRLEWRLRQWRLLVEFEAMPDAMSRFVSEMRGVLGVQLRCEREVLPAERGSVEFWL